MINLLPFTLYHCKKKFKPNIILHKMDALYVFMKFDLHLISL